MTAFTRVEIAHDARAELGEGPLWTAATGLLSWIDVLGHRVHTLDPSTGATAGFDTRHRVALAVPHADGGYLLGHDHGFIHCAPDGSARTLLAPLSLDEPAPSRKEPGDDDRGWALSGNVPSLHLNDGRCDPAGRLWTGTAHAGRAGLGSLLRVDPDGTVRTVSSGHDVSNGVDWSPDGGLMYHVDTHRWRVDVLDFDVATGSATGRRALIEVDPALGKPDGLSVDADGCLWLALWGGGQVRRYTPTGHWDRTVTFPATRVSSCAFAGSTLYVTSARTGLDPAELAGQPYAGALFAVDVAVRGRGYTAFGS